MQLTFSQEQINKINDAVKGSLHHYYYCEDELTLIFNGGQADDFIYVYGDLAIDFASKTTTITLYRVDDTDLDENCVIVLSL